MKSLLTFILLYSFGTLSAQYSRYFMPPVDEGLVSTAKEVYVVTTNADTIKGRMNGATLINGQMRSFTIKRPDKSKVKFKSAEVKLLAIKATGFMNWTSALSTPNIKRAQEMDYEKIMKREWVIFDQALLPNKDKYALMQLLNPDFDSKIKVYLNPNANETASMEFNGLALSGGEDTSYLVVMSGNQSEIVKKRKYKEEALTRLYTNCDDFTDAFKGEDFKWEDFSEHVLTYDQLCK